MKGLSVYKQTQVNEHDLLNADTSLTEELNKIQVCCTEKAQKQTLDKIHKKLE